MTATNLVPVPPDLGEAIRYAQMIVTVGVHPDDPDCVASAVFGGAAMSASRICLHDLADCLREVADQLDAHHGDGPCDKGGAER